MAPSDGSVTNWIRNLKRTGDPVASQRIWRRYVTRLVHAASRKLGNSPRRAADEDDVVAAAFACFFRGVKSEQFASLNDRDDLWQILLILTERSALNQLRHQRAQKRGGGQVLGESALGAEGGVAGLEQYADQSPTPDFAVEVSEQLSKLLDQLDDQAMREIALRKLEGFTNREIAVQLETSLRSVERRLALIRDIWTGN